MPRGKLQRNIFTQFFWEKNKAIGLFTVLEHAILKWGSFTWSRGWELNDDMVFFLWSDTLYPAPQHVPGLQSVQPVRCNTTGCRVFKGHPSAAFEKQQPLCNHDTSLRQWRSQRWQRKNKVQKESWKMEQCNSVFYVCIWIFNNSGIWLTSWSLHCFFFSINLKVWTLHYKIQWQDSFPAAW